MSIAWTLCGVLFFMVLFLFIKIYLLKKDMDEICTEVKEQLLTETNTHIFSSSQDMHVKRLVRELDNVFGQLRQQRQIYLNGHRELKESMTNISHDLRTPLTAIQGYLDLLGQENKSPAAERYIKIIRNRVEMMEYLTEELFNYSIITAYESKPLIKRVALNDLLEESLAEFYIAFKEHHIVPQIQMPASKVYRYLDSSSLSRVFSNLLNNVIKYSNGDLKIFLTETGNITFMNTASQLNEVEVAQLFHRFYTVENGKNSTGLGLSIAQYFVEQMNGTMSAEYINKQLKINIFLPEE